MRTILSFAGFVIFGLVLFALLGDRLIDRAWLDAAGDWTWLAGIACLIADVVVPIPTTLVITALAQRYGPLLGGVLGTLGTFAAGVTAYGLTRLLGRRFARWLLRDELDAAERFYARGGSFAVACSRWLPLLPEAISCMAGLARMPFDRYCLALLSGTAPMAFAYAALAAVSTNETIPLLISVLLPLPIWWCASRLLRRHG